MSSPNYLAYSPEKNLPLSDRRDPFRDDDRGRQAPGPTRQNVYPNLPRTMGGTDFPETSSELRTWHNNEAGLSVAAPALQLPMRADSSTERQPYLSPTSSGLALQSPIRYETQPERHFPRAANMHVRTPSQLDDLIRENAELRQRLEDSHADREQAQQACENMLTELMNTQEALEKTQVVMARKDTELSSFRARIAERSDEAQSPSRNDERELRDLRLRCSRLQTETDRKEKQLQQARADASEANEIRSPHSPQLVEAEQRANTYAQQCIDWKSAYDRLQASNNGMQASNNDLQRQVLQAAHETRSRFDDQAAQHLQALNAKLEDVRKLVDFWKQNSEKLSKTNKEVTDQIRNLRDDLDSKSQESHQQKSTMEGGPANTYADELRMT